MMVEWRRRRRSGGETATGTDGTGAARRRRPRGDAGLLREGSWPANRVSRPAVLCFQTN
jgi:hypothetical protein